MEFRLSRRSLLGSAAILPWTIGLTRVGSGEDPGEVTSPHRPLAIATWDFGKQAVDVALALLASGRSTLDAVEQGIRAVESAGGGSVGLTGAPNAAGYVSLDACIMDGPNHRGGSVSGVEGVPHVISLARRVMEKTRHVVLVGHEARNFAIAEGLETVPIDDHAAKSRKFWETYRPQIEAASSATPATAPAGKGDRQADHDTVTLLVLGADGTISGGCSTSGLADKLPGRVGDSPILGSGLYVDNEVGAAGGTGIGENILRYCASFMIVELMRGGMRPAQACAAAIQRIAANEPAGKNLDIYFIALNKRGEFGAAGTGEFPHAVGYDGKSEIFKSDPVRIG